MVADVLKVLAGFLASLLLFWLRRLYRSRGIKKALHVEIIYIQEKVSEILEIINLNELPDYNYFKKVSTIDVLFKTPIIGTCYGKIDLLPRSIVRDIIEINIILDMVNNKIQKKDKINFATIEMLVGIIRETKPLFIKLNKLTNKVLKVIES